MKVCRSPWSLFLISILAFLAGSPRDTFPETPPVPISSITFEGNRSFTAQQLESTLQISLEDGVLDAKDLDRGLKNLEKFYRDEGYLDARAGPPQIRAQETEAGKTARIHIPLIEGSRYSAGKLEVKNTRVIAPAAFVQMSPLKRGQPYIRAKISRWKELIEDTYSSMGHIRARCYEQETVRKEDKTVDCSLECVEGKAYRVGKISLVADESIDRLQFKRRLLVSEGGLYSTEALITSIRYLNSVRLYKPISMADVDITVDDERGLVDLVWRLSPPGRN